MKKTICLFFISLLISGCTFLKTPEIKGIVLDAETGQAIADARVHAAWLKMSRGPGGEGPGTVDKEIWLRANSEGQFTVPEYLVINFVPYPFGSGGHFSMSIYAHEYFHKSFGYESRSELARADEGKFRDKDKEGRIIFKLEKIKDPDTFAKNLSEIYDYTDKDLDYRLLEYQFFVNTYPSHEKVPGYRLSIASIYKETGNYKEAVIEYERVIKDFPNSSAAKEAQEGLRNLRERQR